MGGRRKAGEDLPEGETFMDYFDPGSKKVIIAKLEPSLAEAKVGEAFQFVRNGYFTLDSEDSKPEAKQAEDARQVDTPQDSWIKAAGGNPDDPYWGKVYQTSQVFGGMTITPDDPEIEIMNKQFSDGESFASAFFEACNKKYFRMNNQSNLASTPALFGSNKKSNSTPDNTPPHFHYQKAFSGGE